MMMMCGKTPTRGLLLSSVSSAARLLPGGVRNAARRLDHQESGSLQHQTRRLSTTEAQEPIKTALYDLHVKLGGKMVEFAGYSLPVQYEGLGVMKEHLHCRSKGCASLFDVSHMGQIKWYGNDRNEFLEKVTVGDVAGLKENEGRLTLIINESGTIVDDAVLANAGDHVYQVVNGARKYVDMTHFETYLKSTGLDAHMEYLGDVERSLLALQGDGAKDALNALLPDSFDLNKLPFMNGVYLNVAGFDARVTRCGYTGEDGFEISIDAKDAIPLAEMLLKSDKANVQPCGLGARDSLRLEAGLCLYGHDLDDTIDPVSAALLWTIGPKGSRRRLHPTFLGAEHILTADGKPKKMSKKRVGLLGHKAPAREGAALFDATGETQVGHVTSGTVSPCLGVPIAMGYVDTSLSKPGTDLVVQVRGKKSPTQVAKMPFVDANYWRVPE